MGGFLLRVITNAEDSTYHNAAMTDDRTAAWNQRYTEKGYLWGIEPNTFLVEVAAEYPPGRVLDLGCGQGRNSVWLATLGHEVTGLDLSPVAIDQARRLAAEAGVDVEFAATDLTQWEPAGEQWDLVVLSYLQVTEGDRARIHAKAIEAMAPGARLFVIAHHLDNLDKGVGGPQYPEVLFTEDQLRADFSELEILACEQVIRRVDKDGVAGDAIDVLLIATR